MTLVRSTSKSTKICLSTQSMDSHICLHGMVGRGLRNPREVRKWMMPSRSSGMLNDLFTWMTAPQSLHHQGPSPQRELYLPPASPEDPPRLAGPHDAVPIGDQIINYSEEFCLFG